MKLRNSSQFVCKLHQITQIGSYMMLDFIRKIFKGNGSSESIISNAPVSNNDDISSYLNTEIDKIDFIKDECRNVVLLHLLGKHDLLKNGEKLPVAEKKALGLNTRVSITREFVAVLNEKGLRSDDPKGIVQNLYYRAVFKKSRTEDLQRIRGIGIKKIKLLSAGDERDCSWCKSVNDRTFDSAKDMIDLLQVCHCCGNCLTFASSATSTQPIIVLFLNSVITEFLFILL
jgi:hypothetical protein